MHRGMGQEERGLQFTDIKASNDDVLEAADMYFRSNICLFISIMISTYLQNQHYDIDYDIPAEIDICVHKIRHTER
ncbi:hypothetical protein KC19_11G160600 [Ceratodon purpureus]|uniref:Uncharacterized protein n=1 Tax=Ceratodon purpureus TaxID=3225 RepID=A0A8T0GHS3_CERPU|nr:hypothetical protein KC19_N030400 [Ceratodon purpureus]KAG0557834.1 hypothetical protein KC19_11G160600 [Ceratodon purpureus]